MTVKEGITFANYFCAICNFANPDDFDYWQLIIQDPPLQLVELEPFGSAEFVQDGIPTDQVFRFPPMAKKSNKSWEQFDWIGLDKNHVPRKFNESWNEYYTMLKKHNNLWAGGSRMIEFSKYFHHTCVVSENSYLSKLFVHAFMQCVLKNIPHILFFPWSYICPELKGRFNTAFGLTILLGKTNIMKMKLARYVPDEQEGELLIHNERWQCNSTSNRSTEEHKSGGKSNNLNSNPSENNDEDINKNEVDDAWLMMLGSIDR